MKKSHLLQGVMVLVISTILLGGGLVTKVLADDQSPQVQDVVVTPPDTQTASPEVPDPTIDTDLTTDVTQDATQTSDTPPADITITQTTEVDTPTITIEATKVICDTDAASPHLGNGTTITATTASDYVAQSDGHCHLAPNWSFQWSDQSTSPSDTPGDLIGEAPGFTTFGPTDDNGSVSVTVPFPSTVTQYHVREVLQAGYIPFTFNEATRDNSNADSAEFYCETDGLNYDDFEYIRNPVAGQTYHCVAFNVPTTTTTDGGGGGTTQTPDVPPVVINTGGGGGISGGSAFTSGGSTGRPAGQVLGASTTACGEYITSYVQLGSKNNDKQNVTNLQAFLNSFLHTTLGIDGVYGQKTFDAVKQFQVAESDQVLVPWQKIGWNPHLVGTGYVYKTTKREINNIVCPSLNLPLPLVP